MSLYRARFALSDEAQENRAEALVLEEEAGSWLIEKAARGPTFLVGYFESEAEARAAAARISPLFPGSQLELGPCDDTWESSYRAHFAVTRIGRFLLVPSWSSNGHESSELLTITLDPGLSFGTDHPTTALCLESLARFVDTHSMNEARFLDVGSGSGVLSIAALKLGFARGLALDVDPRAVLATRLNAERNGVSERLEVRGQELEVALDQRRAELVLANLHAGLLAEHAALLAGCVAAGGWLIVSGFLPEDAASVEASLVQGAGRLGAHFARVNRYERAGWAGLELWLAR